MVAALAALLQLSCAASCRCCAAARSCMENCCLPRCSLHKGRMVSAAAIARAEQTACRAGSGRAAGLQEPSCLRSYQQVEDVREFTPPPPARCAPQPDCAQGAGDLPGYDPFHPPFQCRPSCRRRSRSPPASARLQLGSNTVRSGGARCSSRGHSIGLDWAGGSFWQRPRARDRSNPAHGRWAHRRWR